MNRRPHRSRRHAALRLLDSFSELDTRNAEVESDPTRGGVYRVTTPFDNNCQCAIVYTDTYDFEAIERRVTLDEIERIVERVWDRIKHDLVLAAGSLEAEYARSLCSDYQDDEAWWDLPHETKDYILERVIPCGVTM